ncbi:MAG: response regulator [Acidobacteriia bacterium]|nr:response regulator [Terriglobia bacterium]
MKLQDAVVLIVEDEVSLLEIMGEWLERENCRVLLAENGAQALKLIETTAVDIVISDIRMPVMDGISLLRAIQRRPGRVPAIVLVSGVADMHPREAFGLGAAALILKPMRRQHLVFAVEQILAGHDYRWSNPRGVRSAVALNSTFAGLATAIQQGSIAFGCGGFCIDSKLNVPEGALVELAVEFTDERKSIRGQGVVRWLDCEQEKLGIEIASLDEECRGWVTALTEAGEGHAFIPADTALTTA